ncbi:hypothetical protein HDU93_008010 [Gonapodya sp. JEL0774]|nr:hypothetical protein HDU93_008010 [Gonapodya sp. JEL0774]
MSLGGDIKSRVAILARNYPEYMTIMWSTWCAGAVFVPLNAWLILSELEYVIEHCGCSVLVVDPERLATIAPILPKLKAKGELRHIVLIRSTKSLHQADLFLSVVASELSTGTKELPTVNLGWEDDATIIYSSGTTGRPKGVLSSHRQWTSTQFNGMALGVRTLMRQGLAKGYPEPDPNAPQSIALCCCPFFHINGTGLSFGQTLGGGKLVIMYKWDALAALKIIHQERCTYFGGVPTMSWQLIEHPDFEKYDLTTLQGVYNGGSHASPELFKGLKKKIGTAGAQNGYYERNPASVGIPLRCVGVKITNGDGSVELPRNRPGEIWIRSPTVTKGYWRNPEATAASVVNGWYKSGDIGRIDDEGFLYIEDRSKDMVIRGGENIYCIEVENAIYSHEAIMEAAVIGVPHRTLGEEVAAVVRVKPAFVGKVTAQDIIKHCRSHIAPFKVPVFVDLWTDALPSTESGKVLKRELKGQIAAKKEAADNKSRL